MDCCWIKPLRGMQVRSPLKSGWCEVPMILNGKQVGALLDTGHGRMLVQDAKGLWAAKILRLKCIPGDMRNRLAVGGQKFRS